MYVHEVKVYDVPGYLTPLESIPVDRGNETKSGPQTSTEQQPSAYMPLKNNREPDNFYQPLQFPPTNFSRIIRIVVNSMIRQCNTTMQHLMGIRVVWSLSKTL